MEILQYGFMQRAFLVGLLLAVITPCIGITIVLKRMSMIGDALSHSSLAGVALGLLLGINPVLGAVAVCIAAALGIEAIRKKIPRYSEMAIAIIMSAGIGLAGVLSGFVEDGANFNSFLFGSIVSISKEETVAVCVISAAVLSVLLFFSKELFYIGFDENAARISGVPVKQVNFIFTILTALTVSVASRTVGTLIVSSMLVVPVACGMQMAKSYRKTLICAIIVAVLTTIAGLFLSYYVGVKPGGTIVLLEVVWFLVVVIVKRIATT
ncbi:MAG: metal ABC transporter permease [Lachnospiraceae bacterium]|nr:metal ABC transporter permease [Lachnospiraceae bacterium]